MNTDLRFVGCSLFSMSGCCRKPENTLWLFRSLLNVVFFPHWNVYLWPFPTTPNWMFCVNWAVMIFSWSPFHRDYHQRVTTSASAASCIFSLVSDAARVVGFLVRCVQYSPGLCAPQDEIRRTSGTCSRLILPSSIYRCLVLKSAPTTGSLDLFSTWNVRL